MVAEAEDTDDESYAIDCPMLATERLVMRAPRESDLEQLVALADNRHVAEMLARMPHPYGEAEARAFLAMASSRRAGIVYALTLAGTGTWNLATGSASPTGSAAMPPRRRMRWSTSRSRRPRSRCCMPRPGSSIRPRAASSTSAASSMPARAC